MTAKSEKMMWDWRQFFTAQNLEYGRRDEASDKLASFEMDPEGKWAKGQTTGGFKVEVRIPVSFQDFQTYPNWNRLHGGRLSLYGQPELHYSHYYSCSCAVGKTGMRCRHLANLLFHVEAVHGPLSMQESDEERAARLKAQEIEKKKKIKREPKDFLAGRAAKQPAGLSFPPDMILGKTPFETNQYEIELAESLVSAVSTADIDLALYYNREGEQGLQAEGRIDGNKVSMTLSRDRIVDMKCGCGRSHLRPITYWYSMDRTPDLLCGHMLAFWLRLREKIILENPGDRTDFRANQLLNILSGATLQPAGETEKETPGAGKGRLQLIPRITRDKNDELKLTFDLGRRGERSYAVRGLEKLVGAVQGGQKFSLSKASEVDFATETFDEHSKPWYRMILSRVRSVQNVNETLNRGSRSYYYYSPRELSAGGGIPLAESDLDIVYDLAEGSEIQYQYGGRREVDLIPVGPVSPRIIVRLLPEKDGKEMTGIRMEVSMPRMLQGNLHRYILDSNGFGRVSDGQAKSLQAFHAVSGGEEGGYTCTIGRKKFAEFYYRVLPKLREAEEITLDDRVGSLIDSFLPVEAEFTFYLDLEEGRLTCRTTAGYDDTVLTLGFEKAGTGALRRDWDQEGRVMARVREFFPGADAEREVMTAPADEETLMRILTEGVGALSALGEVRGTDAFHRVRVLPAPQPKFAVRIESGILDLSIETKDLSDRELLELLESYRAKKRWYRLRNGDYIDLREASALGELTEAAEAMDVSMEDLVLHGAKLPKYRSLYVDRLLEEHEDLALSRDKTFKALIRSFQTIRDSDWEVPGNLADVIRPYQQYGFRWLSTLGQSGFGGILADEMGLGKTLQMLAWLQMRKTGGEQKPALVICPASLVYNWLEEAGKFAPGLKAVAMAGRLNERKKMLEDIRAGKGADLYITSYDLLKRDITLYDGLMFSAVILDEAQYIKNAHAAVSKAVRVLKAEQRFALTGTPIENRLSELWSIFDFLMPGFLYSAKEFTERFETPITKKKDPKATAKLAGMTGPFILRRKKEDVLKELPEKLEKTQRASMDDEQRKLYDAQVVHLREMLDNAGTSGEDRIRVLAEITRLRQICCDPSLIFENYHGSSAKREACLELVRNAIDGGHRMLLFSQFTSMLKLLADDLKAAEIPFYTITGATPKQERLRLVNQFNNGDVPVFLISLKAGGTGLNLTGADVVIHYDPWWNLAVQNQATDRAHRIGQTRQVTVVRLIAGSTIEEKILELQEKKRELAEAIITGEANSLMSLSREELLGLLE